MRHHLSSTRQRSDERGSTLVLALCIIIVIGVAGASALSQMASAGNVQRAYGNARDVTLTKGDSPADDAAQLIRREATDVIDGGTGECSSQTDPPSFSAIGTLSNGWKVYCKPADGSGQLHGGNGNVPSSSVLILGGQAPKNVYGIPGSYLGATTTAGAPNPDRFYPFCADYHDYQSGSTDTCEAGLFVGRSGNDTLGGGLYIAYNGTDDFTAPMLKSNGSVITGLNASGDARELDVGGSIEARSYCSGGKGAGTASWFPYAIVSGYNPDTSPTGVAGNTHCEDSDGAGTDDKAIPTAASRTLEPDPDYVHAPIDLDQMCGSTPCVPRVDNGNADAAYQLPLSLCNGANDGFVKMPARAIQVGGVDTGFYTAWYDDVTDLNALMTGCVDSMFWFRPGIYYFDFLDETSVGIATQWAAPQGCIHILGACTTAPSEILAGTPLGWKDDCSPNPYPCPQPTHVMVPNIIPTTLTPGNSWISPGNDLADPTHKSNPVYTSAIDGDVGAAVGYDGVGNPTIPWQALEVPIPQRSPGTKTIVSHVNLEVAYNLPSPSTYYKSSSNDSLNRHGAELDISIPSNGHCYIYLAPGDAITGPHRTVNLDKGCDPAMPGYEKATGGFPSAVVGTPNTTYTAVTAPATSVFNSHPDWVNGLQVNLVMRAETGVQSTDPAKVIVDGMHVKVDFTGRPVPSFPLGCDPGNPAGVQFLFGNTSRMNFGAGSNDQSFFELCAGRTDLFPNWTTGGATFATPYGNKNFQTGTGHDLSPGINGLGYDMAPPEITASTDPSDASSLTIPVTFDSVNSSTNPHWTSSTAAGGNPVPADFNRIGDGKFAYTKVAEWASSNNNTAQLSFKLANMACPAAVDHTAAWCRANGYLPPESTITRVQLQVAHNEGSFAGGTAGTQFRPGANIKPSPTGVQLHVQPGSTSVGRNGYQATPWDSNSDQPVYKNNNFSCVNYDNYGCNLVSGTQGGSYPATCSANPPTGTWSTPPPSANLCTFEWGDKMMKFGDVPTVAGTPPTPGKGKDWTYQRTATDDLNTVEGLSNALFTWSVQVNSGVDHMAWVDGIVAKVWYRPSGSLRPLHGCLTTRTQWRPDELYGASGAGYDWLDPDWGAVSNVNGLNLKGDDAFGNFSAPTGGNGNSSHDSEDCPLVDISNNPGRTKFHIDGMLYSPSAALELSGNDNDAQWVTAGIISRHLSAIRWKNGGGVPAVGDSPPVWNPREAIIEIRDSSDRVRVRAVVRYVDDHTVANGTGSQVIVKSWIRNP